MTGTSLYPGPGLIGAASAISTRTRVNDLSPDPAPPNWRLAAYVLRNTQSLALRAGGNRDAGMELAETLALLTSASVTTTGRNE